MIKRETEKNSNQRSPLVVIPPMITLYPLHYFLYKCQMQTLLNGICYFQQVVCGLRYSCCIYHNCVRIPGN